MQKQYGNHRVEAENFVTFCVSVIFIQFTDVFFVKIVSDQTKENERFCHPLEISDFFSA